MEQLDVLEKEGVSPSAWIWMHAQNEVDIEFHKKTAKAGAWIEFDDLRDEEKSLNKHLALVKILRDDGSIGRVLVSHDAGWYTVGQLRGGEIRGYSTLFKKFVPALKGSGFRDAEITQLIITNPANAFTIGVRKMRRNAG